MSKNKKRNMVVISVVAIGLFAGYLVLPSLTGEGEPGTKTHYSKLQKSNFQSLTIDEQVRLVHHYALSGKVDDSRMYAEQLSSKAHLMNEGQRFVLIDAIIKVARSTNDDNKNMQQEELEYLDKFLKGYSLKEYHYFRGLAYNRHRAFDEARRELTVARQYAEQENDKEMMLNIGLTIKGLSK